MVSTEAIVDSEVNDLNLIFANATALLRSIQINNDD
jgi:hypothetical protein